jgi:hypothetical protein
MYGRGSFSGRSFWEDPRLRGTNRTVENAIADETGLLMSEAAQRSYIQGGSVADALHAS